MIKKDLLKRLAIIPVLRDLNLFSLDAVELIADICGHESKGGTYLHQIGYNGDNQGLGLYAMQLNTVNAIEIYLMKEIREENEKAQKENRESNGKAQSWADKLHSYENRSMSAKENLMYNYIYSAAVCRLFFVRFEEPLPDRHDITAIAKYWKKYYNTSLGKGTIDKFVADNEWYEKQC